MPTKTPQSIHAKRLIVATNRGPVEYYLSQERDLKHRRGPGGVVTALTGANSRMDVTWVAMAMTEADRIAAKEAQQHEGVMRSPLPGQNILLRYVAIPKTAYRKHYEEISNQLLWFLQHYLYDPTEDSQFAHKLQDAWKNGYCVANRAIADAVCAEIDRGQGTPIVMLHDYHLYLAPAMIREQHPTIIMQQFIHIPWPDIRCWQFLPANIAQAIFNGLVGNDIIGFQTERDAHNFLEGARTLLEGSVVDFKESAVWWQGHRTQVHTYPISISVADEKRLAQGLAGRRAVNKLSPLLKEKTIMRVDRIEPTKNILRGFQAYALMLEQHPEWQGKVRFLAFLVPSRQGLAKYKRYSSEVKKLVEDLQKELFERYNIQVEKSTFNTLTLLLTIGTTRSKVSRLYDALMRIARQGHPPRQLVQTPEIPGFTRLRCLPRDAYYCGGELLSVFDERERINHKLSGRVCADQIVPYPPGIPVLVPGQLITPKILEYLARLLHSHKSLEMHGVVHEAYLPCIRVLKSAEERGLRRLS